MLMALLLVRRFSFVWINGCLSFIKFLLCCTLICKKACSNLCRFPRLSSQHSKKHSTLKVDPRGWWCDIDIPCYSAIFLGRSWKMAQVFSPCPACADAVPDSWYLALVSLSPDCYGHLGNESINRSSLSLCFSPPLSLPLE